MSGIQKTIVLFLVFVLFVIPVLSCSADTDEPTIMTTQPDTQSSTAIEEPSWYDTGLTGLDYEDYEVKVLTAWWGDSKTETLSVDEEMGEVLNDAIYQRNLAVKEKLNVRFYEKSIDSILNVPAMAKKSIQSGTHEYDLMMMVDRHAYGLALEGMLYNINDLKNIDLTQPYWDQNAQKALSIDGKLFFAYGDDNLTFFDSMYMLLYNKSMAEDYGLDNPYTLVKEGKWTIDKLYDMMKTVAADVDGDGKWTDADRYGAVFTRDQWFANFWVVNGITLVAKDKDDLPYLNIPGNERLFAIWQKLMDLTYAQPLIFDLNSEKLTKYTGAADHPYNTAAIMFRDGANLFCPISAGYITMLGSMEVDYGIIPFPKDEEVAAGTTYSSRVTGAFPYVVPVTNENPDRVSAILEELACQSRNYVLPAYYDKVLMVKQTRDEESAVILDMLYKNRIIDLGENYWFDDILLKVDTPFKNKTDTFASVTESMTDKAQKVIQDGIDAIQQLS